MRPPKVQRVLTGALVLLLGTLPSIATADTDLDGNGFADEREQFLIERFCPSLVLEANDQGVCPEPVEIVTNHMWASLYGGWEVGDHVYMGEVRDPSMDGANYSNIDNEHHGTFNPWRSYSNTLNCGEAHPVQYQLYHFDFGGRGQWCGEESRDHNDQPTEQTGDDWYTVYKNGNEWTEPGSAFPNTVYAHPFTYQDATDGGLTHVIQYWFFYPFDDWVNNHEGDWEHINVVITGDATTAQVKRVDYYFHETWFVANTTQTENPNSFDCYMIDETHPVIFVGGTWGADFDYYGIEASGSGPGSHGSYCMPGHWTGVQQMPHSIASIDDHPHGDGLWIPWQEFVDDDTTDTDGVVLLKEPSAYDYSVRKDLSWLKADIFWGRTRVWSIGSDHGWAQGNTAPRGPYHQSTWNYPGYSFHQSDFTGGRPYTKTSDANWSPPQPLSLDFPGDGTTVSDIVSVHGSVHYADSVSVLISASASPTNWTKKGIQLVTEPPFVDASIATWNTGTVREGYYTLRVKTYRNGVASTVLRNVYVDHRVRTVAVSGAQYQSISAALVEAEMGDTISVSQGSYTNPSAHPTIDVDDKIVYFRGMGLGCTLYPYANSPIVSIDDPTAQVTFEKVIFKRSQPSTNEESYGIKCDNSWVTFKDCQFLLLEAYDGYAINATGSARIDAEGCLFANNKPLNFPDHARGSVVMMRAVGAAKPTGSFVNCNFFSNEGSAVKIIYDYANPLQGSEPKPYFDGCKIIDNRGVDNVIQISYSSRTINFTSCTIGNNQVVPSFIGTPEAAIFCDHAKVLLDNCTIAHNTQYYPNSTFEVSGVSINSSGTTLPVTIDDSIIAFNAGPVVNRSNTQVPTDVTLTRCIVFENTSSLSGYARTDAQWATAGTSVFEKDPAFCSLVSGYFTLYAFSPAAPDPYDEYGVGLPFTERVGAQDVNCVPAPTSITVATGNEAWAVGAPIVGCPQGDLDHFNVHVTFSETQVTRPLNPAELSLQSPYLTKGIVSDGKVKASGSAGYTLTLDHPNISGYGSNDQLTLLLDGHPLAQTVAVVHRSVDMKGGSQSCPGDTPCPDGKVSNPDLNWFVSHYPTGSFHPPYFEGADYFASPPDTISNGDFNFFVMHFAGSGHKYSGTGTLLQTVGEEQTVSTHVVLDFTEEFVTATDHRLYVDVALDDCADKNWCLFALKPNRSDLTLSSFEPTAWAASSAPFAPVETPDEQELYFGVFMINDTDESTRRLGRLVFDVAGSDPITITDDQFVVTTGEVAIANGSNGQAFVIGDQPEVYAHMGGVSGRLMNSTVHQVFHDRLEQNFPNPFNPQTTLAYSLKSASEVFFAIYDVGGRRVRELVNEHQPAGAYKLVWDGTDAKGSKVASGVYFYKLVAGSFTATKKMVMLK